MPRDASPEPTEQEVDALLARGRIVAHVQPIVRLGDGRIMGYEALARMHPPPPETLPGMEATSWDPDRHEPPIAPDRWIAAAQRCGRRTELELRCLEAALANGLPPGDALFFVNLSASTFSDRRAVHLFAGCHDRIVLELSESEVVADYRTLREQVFAWTSRGARLAIDDTGSGYASLRHVLQLRPDFIKLDRSLVAGLDRDRNRRALADALVAFAHGVGAEVIAEGVEHAAEVAELRAVGVTLVQGYLFARPAPPWPDAADPTVTMSAVTPRTLAELATMLATAADPQAACEVAAAYLSEIDSLLPSVYLLRGNSLRCEAQRGLWQVLDGMAPGVGVTGRCFAEGREIVVSDVGTDTGYLEAIPGVRSEVCVPIRVDGMAVGALNVEARHEIDESTIEQVRQCARYLGARLGEVGRAPNKSPLDSLGGHIQRLSEAPSAEAIEVALLDGVRHLTALNSAAVVCRDSATGPLRVRSVGPLRDRLDALSSEEYDRLARLVQDVSSSYTSGSSVDEGFIGLDELRRSGVRGLVVVPLRAGSSNSGLLVIAHSAASALSTREVEPVEILGSMAAARLAPSAAATSTGRPVEPLAGDEHAGIWRSLTVHATQPLATN